MVSCSLYRVEMHKEWVLHRCFYSVILLRLFLQGIGRMAEDPEDLDRFLYGDEGTNSISLALHSIQFSIIAPLIAAGDADNKGEKPASGGHDEMAEDGEAAAVTRSELEDGEQEDDEEEDIEFVFGSNPVTEPVKCS